MKNTILLSIAFALMLGACNSPSNNNEQSNLKKDSTEAKNASTAQTFELDTTKLKSGEPFYQCEMHPEVLSDKPGNCPKCGMELSKIMKQ